MLITDCILRKVNYSFNNTGDKYITLIFEVNDIDDKILTLNDKPLTLIIEDNNEEYRQIKEN